MLTLYIQQTARLQNVDQKVFRLFHRLYQVVNEFALVRKTHWLEKNTSRYSNMERFDIGLPRNLWGFLWHIVHGP